MHSALRCISTLLPTLAMTFVACGGPDKSGGKRPYPERSVEELLAHLGKRDSHSRSFLAESRMEYWLDGNRVKPTIYVMGERGSKVRFNALDPSGSTVADLACDGSDFQFVDYDKNCILSGPCTRSAIAQLLRITLAPDDFFLLAIGSTPVIDSPSGIVKWNNKTGNEEISLKSADGLWKQRIVLDGREGRWDVLQSTVWYQDDKIEWQLTNKDFVNAKTEDGKTIRLPEKTKFEQPQVKAEVLIRWVERNINEELDEAKFTIDMPPLSVCAQDAQPATAQPVAQPSP